MIFPKCSVKEEATKCTDSVVSITFLMQESHLDILDGAAVESDFEFVVGLSSKISTRGRAN
jgi:hypothetical protein